ncbi:MAG: tRNA 2-thiouridine(34) synthase MnmA, partial [Bacteroidales bacterium]|nr:tRNA 2-thiouridine(34) synthase MnmA [Bacteroidales bacterium]
VDSSVAALLLKRQGYDVFAMYMQNWHDIEGTLHGECEWEEEKFVAEMVARKIGIPFYFVDLSKEYMAQVADYMFDEYARGRTPNPDVLCNSKIKFDAFLKAAESLGADMVATGHYCRRRDNADGTVSILEGYDPNKDQSYFLCQLTQEQLSKAMFPIGDICKPEVRRIAKEAELQSADKKDSQGICFVGKVDLPVFLQQKLKSVEGEVIEVFPKYYEDHPEPEFARPYDYSDIVFETETYRSGRRHVRKTRNKANPWGIVAGHHEGAQFYTVGQRKGLSIGGHTQPLFVIGTDIESNRIYVGEGENHPGLYRKALKINTDEVHWIRPNPDWKPGASLRCKVRIRYRQPLQEAELKCMENGTYIVFDQAQRAVTPGQFAVWYADDSEMLGSGVINE